MSISPSRLRPPFALDAEDDGSVASASTTGFRRGGPKEARLHRVALLSDTKETSHLHPVKIQNIPRTASAESLFSEFSEFGEIGDVYIPTNLKDGKPAKDFAIIRFTDKKVAETALSSPERTATKVLNGSQLMVSPLSKQASFFSNNTGRLGIANEVCISHVPERKSFCEQHISLASVRSRSGYPWGSVRELKYLNPKPSTDILEYHSIKLVDLARHIT
jgi:RNA recognition motif-containing protein